MINYAAFANLVINSKGDPLLTISRSSGIGQPTTKDRCTSKFGHAH